MTRSSRHAGTPLEVEAPDERARAVRDMFSAIAPRYDLLNHLLSLNIDRTWRRRAVSLLNWEARPEGRYLDSCAGTLDLALELARQAGFCGSIVAADFSPSMLRAGTPKIGQRAVHPLGGDALCLPLVDECFDGAMVGFGVRNLARIDAGFRELHRVLRPGARLVILDFTTPEIQPLRWLYLAYFTRVLPFVGRLVSKHSHAYSYLPESVLGFDRPGALADRMEAAGFGEVGWRRLTAGVACVWWGIKATLSSEMG